MTDDHDKPRVLIVDDETRYTPELVRTMQRLSAGLRIIVAGSRSDAFFDQLRIVDPEPWMMRMTDALSDSESLALAAPPPPNQPYYQNLKPGKKGKKRHY